MAVFHAALIGGDHLLQLGGDQVRAELDPEPLRIDLTLLEPCLGAGHVRRREGQLDVAAHELQGLPRTHVLCRIEVGDLGADQGYGVRAVP